MVTLHLDFEFFAGCGILILLGSAWTHLAVKLDRLTRGQIHHGHCMKRIRLRLAAVERWLPPRQTPGR